MNFLKKVQNLPEGKRKVILWSFMVIISVFLIFLFINHSKKRFQSFNEENIKEGLNFPDFEEEMEKLPKIEFPEIKLPDLVGQTTTQETADETPIEQNQP